MNRKEEYLKNFPESQKEEMGKRYDRKSELWNLGDEIWNLLLEHNISVGELKKIINRLYEKCDGTVIKRDTN